VSIKINNVAPKIKREVKRIIIVDYSINEMITNGIQFFGKG